MLDDGVTFIAEVLVSKADLVCWFGAEKALDGCDNSSKTVGSEKKLQTADGFAMIENSSLRNRINKAVFQELCEGQKVWFRSSDENPIVQLRRLH